MKRRFWLWPLLSILLLAGFSPLFVYGAEPLKIGFIDTGISTKHFAEGQVGEGKNYVFPHQDTEDREGHGTATAGMVLGSEKLGLAGSCPKAVAVPLVTIDKYASGVVKKGDVSLMCQAIYEAIDVYGCRVINISMGVPEDGEELRQAVEYAEEMGVVIVSAAGNDHALYPERSYYPASYSTVIGVGAAAGPASEDLAGIGIDKDRWTVADFSQRNGISVLARGLNVATVTNRNAAEINLRSGTSYACAYVAGLCARLLTGTPSLTPAEVRGVLYAGAQEFGVPGRDDESGWGLVGLAKPSTDKVTRGMLVSFLYESAGGPILNGAAHDEVATFGAGSAVDKSTRPNLSQSLVQATIIKESPIFLDVPAESYYVQAVAWAAETGVVRGYSSTHFGPEDEVSREQMAAIMMRYAHYRGFATNEKESLATFVDQGAVSAWARGSMEWAVAVGLIRGRGNGIIDPLGSATRIEVAAIMQRFFASVLN